MYTKIEVIGPQTAAAYLNSNKNNRPVRQRWVDALAAMMERGEFTLTHQGIAFSVDGDLIDGQHRLHAIIQSGKTVQMCVTRGAEPDTYKTIDSGAVRLPSDRSKLVKHERQNIFACAHVREFLIQSGGANGPLPNRSVCAADIEAFFAEHGAAVEMVSKRFLQTKVRGICRSAIGAAIMCYATHDPDKAAAFMERLISGLNLTENDPAYVLRTSLLYGRIALGSRDEYWKAIRACQADADGSPIGRLVPATTDFLGGRYLTQARALERSRIKAAQTRAREAKQ